MTTADYLIIGGGIAGTTAAETIREHDTQCSIHIVTAEPHQFYSRMMLSKPDFYLKRDQLDKVYLKPKSWFEKHNIDSTLGDGAKELDVLNKIVTLNDGQQIGYKKLLLAFGMLARRWTVPGADKHGVMYLRTLDDAKHVIDEVKTAKQATVIGGGFIAFEMCHLFEVAGIETTLILREKYFWEPLLDEVSGRLIEEGLKKGGIKIVYQNVVDEVLGEEHVTAVKLHTGEEIPTDMVIVGIGTDCPVEWVKKAGVACNHGILANEYLETSAPDVYAAGDIAEYEDLILHEKIQIGNWRNAHMHGEVAAMNMMGKHHPFHHTSFYSAQAGSINVAFVGDVRLLPDRKVIERKSPDGTGLTRILLVDNHIEGATMINRPADLASIVSMTETSMDVSKHLEQLADPMSNLEGLLK